jgi:hypothetical protein
MRKGKIMKTKYCSDEQLTQLIDAPPMPCAALCGVTLSTLNLISGDTVHEDCRCARSCPGARTASRAPVPVRAPPVPRIYEVISAWQAARHLSTYICSCVS